MNDLIIKQIAKVAGDYVGGKLGSQIAGTAVSLAIAEAEITNLINNIPD